MQRSGRSRRKRKILAVVDGPTGARVKSFSQADVRKIKVADTRKLADKALNDVLAHQSSSAHQDDDDDDDHPYSQRYDWQRQDRDQDDEPQRNEEGDEDTARRVMAGREAFEISHQGGEWEELISSFKGVKRTRKDHRTRRDRTEKMNQRWANQMSDLGEAYMGWSHDIGLSGLENSIFEHELDDESRRLNIRVVDLFNYSIRGIKVPLHEDSLITPAFIRQGVVPCAPVRPTVAISTRTLEHYRVLHMACPRLSIQPFVKSLCEIHGAAFKPYLATQFSIAFDVYLSILDFSRRHVMATLGRDTRDWRLQNSCPSCQYKLNDEPKLKYDILAAMDGNNSHKRLARREHGVDEEGNILRSTGASKERLDTRKGGGTYYLSREEVDEWEKDKRAERMATLGQQEQTAEVEGEEDEDDPRICKERWKNLSEEKTNQMWAIFEETGIFTIVCRHGFILLIADMVRSGESSKYPLSILNRLFEACPCAWAVGYDVGCEFVKTVDTSPLGPKAKALGYKSLVGLFHGHAHNRLCQTSNLTTYVDGAGLEDFEGNERLYSVLNDLAIALRHASIFHRRQAIAGFAHHRDNFETYANLSKFIVDNYKQALEILAGKPALLRAMDTVGVKDPATFSEWLKEERTYLSSLKKVPEEETLQMEYYSGLVSLNKAEAKLLAAQGVFQVATSTSQDSYAGDKRKTASLETARRNALEKWDNIVAHVQDLEKRLEIAKRWTPSDAEWKTAEELVEHSTYRRCVDQLESLIVARMFELAKMNMSRTGYKLRRHIANALQARSQAIRTALENYNAAAAKIKPKAKPQLKWEQVVEYAFLADFDLLRDTREDVNSKPWAKTNARPTMDHHFKILRAQEEIQRLNVEIRRLITYMMDEEAFLKKKKEELQEDDPYLAHQVLLYRLERGRFNDQHWSRLRALSKIEGFTGSLTPGVGDLTEMDDDGEREGMDIEPGAPGLQEDDVDDDEGEDVDEVTLNIEMLNIVAVSTDGLDPL